MGSIGTPFAPPFPFVGQSGPTFATRIIDIFTEMKLRLEAQLPISSLDLSSNLNMQGAQILNAGYLTLANVGSAPGASPVNRLTAFSGDLYYVSPSGAIQITTAGTLNAAAVGGIIGDYGGAFPAKFRYDLANARFDAYQDFANNILSDIRAFGFEIAAGPTSGIFLTLRWGGASNKTYTFPATTASAGTRPMYMDTSGNITLGGGAKSYNYGMANATGSGTGLGVGADGGFTDAGSGIFQASMPASGLLQDFVVQSLSVHWTNTSGSSLTFALKKAVPGGAESTLVTNTNTTVGTGLTTTITLGAADTVVAGAYYRFVFGAGGGGANTNRVYGFSINGTLPA